MSKNIEVLLRAKETTELFGAIATSQKSSEDPCISLRTDPIGSVEEAELVRRVFMLPAHEVPRVVVFCGVGQGRTWPTTQAPQYASLRETSSLPLCTSTSAWTTRGDFPMPSSNQGPSEISFTPSREATSPCSSVVLTAEGHRHCGNASGCDTSSKNSAKNSPMF